MVARPPSYVFCPLSQVLVRLQSWLVTYATDDVQMSCQLGDSKRERERERRPEASSPIAMNLRGESGFRSTGLPTVRVADPAGSDNHTRQRGLAVSMYWSIAELVGGKLPTCLDSIYACQKKE